MRPYGTTTRTPTRGREGWTEGETEWVIEGETEVVIERGIEGEEGIGRDRLSGDRDRGRGRGWGLPQIEGPLSSGDPLDQGPLSSGDPLDQGPLLSVDPAPLVVPMEGRVMDGEPCTK